ARRPEATSRPPPTAAGPPGMRPLLAHCHRGLGMLYAQMRQREQAHTELSTAMALYRAMDMPFWLPQAKAALAQVDGAGGPREGGPGCTAPRVTMRIGPAAASVPSAGHHCPWPVRPVALRTSQARSFVVA